MAATTGRDKAKRTARARRRGSQPKAKRLAPQRYGTEHFRFRARRPRPGVKLPDVYLDPILSEATWGRQGSKLQGSLTINRPALRNIAGLIVKGDVVRCEVAASDGAPFRPLWEMGVQKVTPSVAAGSYDVTLASQLATAQRSHSHWKFRKDRRHPHGWRADDVARAAAKRFRVRLGKLARGKHRILKLVDKSASVLEIVTQAYQQERHYTGRRFDVSIARGLLEVTELRRPRYMLLMGATLIDAVIDDALAAGFASAIVVTSTVKVKGHKARRKLRVKVVDRARVRRYGYIVRHVDVHGITTRGGLRKHGRELLARTRSPVASATLTHPGIPWTDRGDAVDLDLSRELGVRATVYVTGVQHTLSYGDYSMDVTVSVSDPWAADERAARVARRKAAARRQRQRRGHTTAPRLKPAKARRRG